MMFQTITFNAELMFLIRLFNASQSQMADFFRPNHAR